MTIEHWRGGSIRGVAPLKIVRKLFNPKSRKGKESMKTLDEIINNEHYEKLNGALIERSIELAGKVRKAMRSAEITEVGDYSIN